MFVGFLSLERVFCWDWFLLMSHGSNACCRADPKEVVVVCGREQTTCVPNTLVLRVGRIWSVVAFFPTSCVDVHLHTRRHFRTFGGVRAFRVQVPRLSLIRLHLSFRRCLLCWLLHQGDVCIASSDLHSAMVQSRRLIVVNGTIRRDWRMVESLRSLLACINIIEMGLLLFRRGGVQPRILHRRVMLILMVVGRAELRSKAILLGVINGRAIFSFLVDGLQTVLMVMLILFKRGFFRTRIILARMFGCVR
mmetsp:Transcript_29078/g.65913  ORF Transcript_29078/g.65913 Transcript_29078/m.65913 type:complete len:250 (-) Transcript_29078:142-891(-)